ncbi:unnamed protein product [Spirodela intermedia]|uniref:SET domain-containing protein n=1 Tax=Spirodela intermedia TaxID=51605 RepID=A0A7I8IQU8_SPIIN|nr:unnamed protein product [Spirodela intermedia]CAA6659381.1 unnamed protein product [Spirodela intermedia]
MASATASKLLLTATADFLSSSTCSLRHRRALAVSASRYPRIAPFPQDLVGWVKREGGFVHPKLKIADGGEYGLTLVASEDIPRGSRLVALPERLTLRLRWSQDDDCADRPDSPLSQLVKRVPGTVGNEMGLKLLQERAKTGSLWWPYISNLPEAFDIPIFFSGEDIKTYSMLLLFISFKHAFSIPYQVNKRCRFLLAFEKDVKSVLEDVDPGDHPFSGQDVNASSLGWAMSAVSSRAFRLRCKTPQDGSGADVPVLLPLIDMCNHSFNPNAVIVEEKDNQKLLVVSKTSIETDVPVTLNYGSLTNDFFLLDYGFVISSNPHDHVELKYDGVLLDAAAIAAGVPSPSFSSPTEWQREILSSSIYMEMELFSSVSLKMLRPLTSALLVQVNLGGEEKVDGRLLAAFRAVLSDDREAAQKSDLSTLMSLSAEAPWEPQLRHFPTKIMEDESILKGDISESTRLAVEFRLQKKLMIVDLMRELTRRVKVLPKEAFLNR